MNENQIYSTTISQYNFKGLKHIKKVTVDIDSEIYEKVPGFESLRKIFAI